ncbi:DUF559 domain-containing protein [Aeromicrobium sp. NPDC092404]|uniref:DUF559 domain-containing protein n=1 Tax=Aeromicrobium sp. NPDC092404 TaxID=3154976 RepID=UPI00342C5928
MPAPIAIPLPLLARPFTLEQAAACGVSRKVVRGRRFRRVFRGVYVSADVDLSLTTWLYAALLVLPGDAVVSHLTALRLWGFDSRRSAELEFSTNSSAVTVIPRVRLHRRQGRLTPEMRDGIPVTGPDRTFVDSATRLSIVELVQAAEHLIHTGATSFDRLVTYCLERHLHGVRRARRAMALVVPGAESPMETLVRLMLVFARLPCPEPNVWIVDDAGRRVARADLLFARQQVVVEYDGWQHERSSAQRQRDRERREVLEALGYRLIVVTDADLRTPRSIPWRVHAALAARGYDGPRPVTSEVWHRWFTRTF